MRALALWRAFKALRRRLEAAASDTGRRLTATERRVEELGGRLSELDRSRAQLMETAREAAVLARALGEALELVGRVRALVPGK